MKKAASSPSLPIHKLATSSTSPKLQKKQSWYDNLRQKTFKKSSHICKVKCGKKGRHKCRYLYVYQPGLNDTLLFCTSAIEPCSEETIVRLRLLKRTSFIAEPQGACYTVRNKKKPKVSRPLPNGECNYVYYPAMANEHKTLSFSEVGIKHKLNSRKPVVIADATDPSQCDIEQEAIADLIDIVKTRRRNTKQISRESGYESDKDTNANVVCCNQRTKDKQDTLEVQSQKTEYNVDNAKVRMSNDISRRQSQLNMEEIEMDKANGTSRTLNISCLEDNNQMNNNNNDALSATEDYSGSADNSNIVRKQNAADIQELNYTGSDTSMIRNATPNGPIEGSVYSDCYLSSSGLIEHVELDKRNLNYVPKIQVHMSTPRRNVSPDAEVPQMNKRLKIHSSEEDLSELDCGQYLDVDQSSLEGASSDVTEGSDDGWRKRKRKEAVTEEEKMSSFYSYHVAASLVNNSSAIMLFVDHKMASGAIKSSCNELEDGRLPALDSDIQYFHRDGEDLDEASDLVDIHRYGDPEEDTIGEDNRLMSYTHSYMKRKGEDAASIGDNNNDQKQSVVLRRSKSIGTSVSKAFTDALSKLEEISHDSRNKQFHKLFPEVPEDEEVINTYSCALCREILLHGRMFVSQNWICFHSNIFTYETQVVVRVSSIIAITKERTAIVVPNAIGIVTHDEKHVFGSLLSRHATHKQLLKVWKGTTGTEDEDHSSSPGSEDTDSECLDIYLPQKSEISADAIELLNGNAIEDGDVPVPADLNGDTEDGVPRKRAASYRRKSSVEKDESVSLNSSENSSKISKVVCAMSVFKSLLRIISSLKGASQTQIFLGLTIILLICLTTSALVLSYRISRLEPHIQDKSWADSATKNVESLETSFWSTSVNHKQKVAQIQDALSSQLESLSKIHSSLELLHHSTFKEKQKDQKDNKTPNEKIEEDNL